LRLLINGASTKGLVTGNAGLTYDTVDRSNTIKVFPSATVAIEQTVGPRLRLDLLDSYSRTDEASQADVFGLRTERRTFETNSFALSANYLIDQITTRGFYQNTIFLSGGTDTISHVLGASASSPFGTVNTATVGYQFTESETSQSGSGSGSGSSTIGHTLSGSVTRQTGQFSTAGLSSSYTVLSGGDTRIWNVSLFTTYGLPTGLSLSGSIGYSLLSAKNQPDNSGITSNSSLSYRFTRATIAIGVFQDFRQTALEGQNFGIVETRGYTGTFLYTFTPFITGSLQSIYTTNQNTGIGNNQSAPASRNLSASAGLNWTVLRWLIMNLQYTYTLRNTTGGSVGGNGDITENRAVLSLFATF
jgi:hypothetical protein